MTLKELQQKGHREVRRGLWARQSYGRIVVDRYGGVVGIEPCIENVGWIGTVMKARCSEHVPDDDQWLPWYPKGQDPKEWLEK